MRKKLSKLQNKNIKKIREINLLIKLQINLSVCRTSDYQLLLSFKQLSWQQKRCGGNHRVYILLKWYKLACSVGCRKNHWNTMNACMWHLHWNGVPGNPPQKMSMCYSNAFKRHWRNIEKICLDIILLTLDMILHIFLWPKAHLFWFNCNFHVGILSNKEAILWRCTLKELFSVKPSQNISKKEPILIKLAPMLKMFCVTNVLLGTWSTFTDQLF